MSDRRAAHPTTTGRPGRLVLVTGTGTEVGKTWWTAALAAHLSADGLAVVARKPVQSSEPGATTDAEVLAAATGEPPDAICPPHRTYRLAWAPPMAAAQLGKPPFTVADLVHEACFPPATDVALVEGAGGVRSPVAADGDHVDLARALRPDLVVLVADAGLGAVNAVRLCAGALAAWPLVVALNHFGDDPLHRRNCEWLSRSDGLTVVTSPPPLAGRIAALPG